MRIAVTILFFLIILLIVWGVIILTAYLQVSVAKKIVDDDVSSIQNSDLTKTRDTLAEASSNLKKDLNQLDSIIINPSVIIEHLVNNQPEGVSINNIHVTFQVPTEGQDANAKIAEIELNGIANTRSNLVLFQQNLSDDLMFASVDIPYSNFTKNENVPFNAKIVSVDLIKFLKNE